MATTVRAAAIYARISSDQDQTALGVGRQVQDCERLANELGWTVAERYVDNDVSAYSGKRRPAYERMLADLADGTRDAVLIYHVDRLTRRPIELEQFLNVVTAAKVRHVRFVSGGDLDIGNGDGLMVLRMLLAVAANESATKSRRVKRKLEQVAESGMPHGGGRPFGYESDKMTIRAGEAAVLRDMTERFAAGESLRSLANWLAEQQIPTVTGGPWRTTALRAILRSGRIAGLREHQGQIIGQAAWPPIISEELRARILSRMDRQSATGRRQPRSYLLSGLLRCGKCGNRLYSSRREATRRYVCLSGPDHGGCGGIHVVAMPVEELIAEAVLYRLDTPELADALANRAAANERAAELAQSLSNDRAQLIELSDLFAARRITAPEWMRAREPIEARIKDAERALMRQTSAEPLRGFVGNAEQLRADWSSLNLTRQAAIVSTVLDHAVITPGQRGARRLDPERVHPVWAL